MPEVEIIRKPAHRWANGMACTELQQRLDEALKGQELLQLRLSHALAEVERLRELIFRLWAIRPALEQVIQELQAPHTLAAQLTRQQLQALLKEMASLKGA